MAPLSPREREVAVGKGRFGSHPTAREKAEAMRRSGRRFVIGMIALLLTLLGGFITAAMMGAPSSGGGVGRSIGPVYYGRTGNSYGARPAPVHTWYRGGYGGGARSSRGGGRR